MSHRKEYPIGRYFSIKSIEGKNTDPVANEAKPRKLEEDGKVFSGIKVYDPFFVKTKIYKLSEDLLNTFENNYFNYCDCFNCNCNTIFSYLQMREEKKKNSNKFGGRIPQELVDIELWIDDDNDNKEEEDPLMKTPKGRFFLSIPVWLINTGTSWVTTAFMTKDKRFFIVSNTIYVMIVDLHFHVLNVIKDVISVKFDNNKFFYHHINNNDLYCREYLGHDKAFEQYWEKFRLIWIAVMKENSLNCPIAILPLEIIYHIQDEYFKFFNF